MTASSTSASPSSLAPSKNSVTSKYSRSGVSLLAEAVSAQTAAAD